MAFKWKVDLGRYKLLSLKEFERTYRAYSALGLTDGPPPPAANGDLEPKPGDWWIAAFRGVDGRPRDVREYHPLGEHPSLYRTFAETKADREGVLNFASTYGLLGLRESTDATNSLVDDQGFWSNWEMESIADWVGCIFHMRWAIQIWDLLLTKNESALDKYVHLRGTRAVPGGVHRPGPILDSEPSPPARGEPPIQIEISIRRPRMVVFDLTPPLEYGDVPEAPFLHSEIIIASEDEDRDVLRRYEDTEDPVPPAHLFVQRTINRALHRRVSIELRWDDYHEELRMEPLPSNLLGAMWLQFAEDVARKTLYRRCLHCDDWFGVATKIARADKEYCSDSCRVQAYRMRRGKAQRLAEAGGAAADIAKKVGSRPETVKRWLASAPSDARPVRPRNRRGSAGRGSEQETER